MTRVADKVAGAKGRSSARFGETARPRANPSVLYRELRTGCLLYHPDMSEIHALNLTAAYIWSYCDGEMDVAGIATQVAEACRVPLGDAQRDTQTALRDFRAKKLLV